MNKKVIDIEEFRRESIDSHVGGAIIMLLLRSFNPDIKGVAFREIPWMQDDNAHFYLLFWFNDGSAREQRLADCESEAAAKAALAQAVSLSPDTHILLCLRSRVISVHKPRRHSMRMRNSAVA